MNELLQLYQARIKALESKVKELEAKLEILNNNYENE